MSTSLEAKDYYGLPLHIGDFVISIDSDLAGEITDIREKENCLWLTVNDEDYPKPIKDLNPSSFTTPGRLAEFNEMLSN